MAKPHPDKFWPEWTDKLGQVYRPGDIIAIAIINGRSPQMVFAEVLEIHRLDSKNQPITEDYWEPGINQRTGNWTEYGTRKTRPACKVRAQPLVDARGFYRSENAKPVTYSIWQNIIKIDSSVYDLIEKPKIEEGERLRQEAVDLRKELG